MRVILMICYCLAAKPSSQQPRRPAGPVAGRVRAQLGGGRRSAAHALTGSPRSP